MQLAQGPEELDRALNLAKREALANFGNDAVYLERYLYRPRHIEVQIIADNHGTVVHLGERDCSLKRSYKKVVEAAAAAAMSAVRTSAVSGKSEAVRVDFGGTGCF